MSGEEYVLEECPFPKRYVPLGTFPEMLRRLPSVSTSARMPTPEEVDRALDEAGDEALALMRRAR